MIDQRNVGLFFLSLNQKKVIETMTCIFFMAGVLGFEPRKCQIQSLMPYRLAIPQCALLVYTKQIGFASCILFYGKWVCILFYGKWVLFYFMENGIIWDFFIFK